MSQTNDQPEQRARLEGVRHAVQTSATTVREKFGRPG